MCNSLHRDFDRTFRSPESSSGFGVSPSIWHTNYQVLTTHGFEHRKRSETAGGIHSERNKAWTNCNQNIELSTTPTTASKTITPCPFQMPVLFTLVVVTQALQVGLTPSWHQPGVVSKEHLPTPACLIPRMALPQPFAPQPHTACSCPHSNWGFSSLLSEDECFYSVCSQASIKSSQYMG